MSDAAPHGRATAGALESSPLAVAETVCEAVPPRPSAAVARADDGEAIAARRDTTRARLARRLEGDLDTIVAAALQKEPDRRYESVDRLDDDVRRHLEGLPVPARPDGLLYRARKALRRHRVAVAAAGAVALALVAATIVSGRFAADAGRQRDAAQAERDRAEELFDTLLDRSMDAALDAGVRVHVLAGGTRIDAARDRRPRGDRAAGGGTSTASVRGRPAPHRPRAGGTPGAGTRRRSRSGPGWTRPSGSRHATATCWRWRARRSPSATSTSRTGEARPSGFSTPLPRLGRAGRTRLRTAA